MQNLPIPTVHLKAKAAMASWLIPVIFSAAAYAAAPVLVCPASIQEKSLGLVDTPSGWTAFAGSPLYLHGAESDQVTLSKRLDDGIEAARSPTEKANTSGSTI
jgi:hypothetical protein